MKPQNRARRDPVHDILGRVLNDRLTALEHDVGRGAGELLLPFGVLRLRVGVAHHDLVRTDVDRLPGEHALHPILLEAPEERPTFPVAPEALHTAPTIPDTNRAHRAENAPVDPRG